MNHISNNPPTGTEQWSGYIQRTHSTQYLKQRQAIAKTIGRSANEFSKRTVPDFEYKPVTQPKQPLWMHHGIDRQSVNSSRQEGVWATVIIIAAIVIVGVAIFLNIVK